MIQVNIHGTTFAVPSLFRLPMYYHYLLETLKLLDQWAEEFPFSASALRDARLVEELAHTLDDYAAQQVVADINRFLVPVFHGRIDRERSLPEPEFLQYCYCRFCLLEEQEPEKWDGQHLDAYQKDFQDLAKNGFRDFECFRPVPESLLHPITLLALRHLSESLWNGIALLCGRLDRALPDLGRFFFDGRIPRSLVRILSAGGRRRKGGARTLTLKFLLDDKCFGTLVYKPFDLEKDFLYLGDIEHARQWLACGRARDPVIAESLGWCKERTTSGFSLFAVFNRLTGARLPILKILPCVPGSALHVDDRGRIPEIREPYGFMEYLAPDGAGAVDSREAGMLAALARTFSLDECGARNIVFRGGRTYLVDVETHAFGPIPSARETMLPEALRGEDIRTPKSMNVTGDFRGLSIEYRDEPPAFPDGATPLARLNGREFEAGYAEAMTHLARHATSFLGWLPCLNGVVTRVMPYVSEELERVTLMLHCHDRRFREDGGAWVMDVADYAVELTHHAEEEFRRWCREKSPVLSSFGDPGLLDPQQRDRLFRELHPSFCIYLSRALLLDGIRGDLPAFYHRLGTRDLLGSDGSVIRFTLQGTKEPALQRAMAILYGDDRQTEGAYFPRESLAVMAGHLRRLAEDPAYAALSISKPGKAE